MSKQSRWVDTESERWVAEQIVTPDQAARIRQLYAAPESSVWGLILFFGLGAIVIGLGVILLLAYNWADIPKFGKLALILVSLLAAHGGGYWFHGYPDWRQRLSEALFLLGTMLFGAAIWLIAQLYNIDEHYPNGFLLWAAGALALAWVLGSVPQGMVGAVLLAIWGGTEAFGFSVAIDWSSLLLLVTVAPLAWRLRSPLLGAALLASLYWLLLCNAAHWGGAAGAFGNAIALSALLIAIEKFLAAREIEADLRMVVRFFGLLGFVVCGYLLSFHDIVSSLLHWERAAVSPLAQIYRWLGFGLAALAWVSLLPASRRTVVVRPRREEWLIPIALVYAQVMTVSGMGIDAEFVAGVFNLVCLGLATAWMVRGCRMVDLGMVACGSALLALIVFARYFDLFESLALRGLVFLALGGVLFAEGFFYRRIRAEVAEKGPS